MASKVTITFQGNEGIKEVIIIEAEAASARDAAEDAKIAKIAITSIDRPSDS
jgi:hypothetical protein